MQLDLFFDSRDTQLRNDTIAALRRRDGDALRESIARLRAEFSDDYALADLDLLADAMVSSGEDIRLASVAEIAERLKFIDTQLVPALCRLLGGNSANRWLETLFKELAGCPAVHVFQREWAFAHAGALFLCCNDLANARAAILRIASWRRIPEPLSWMTEIAWRENDPAEYWPLSAELAWIAPVLFEAVLSRAAPDAVRRWHAAFLAEFEADDGDDGDSAWFPAWLLVEHGELLEYFRPIDHHPSNPARCTALLVGLLIGERHGLSSKLVEQRQQLRSLAPRLFARYMALR
jgi:hypothetical protein